jgi:hypothetical protein
MIGQNEEKPRYPFFSLYNTPPLHPLFFPALVPSHCSWLLDLDLDVSSALSSQQLAQEHCTYLGELHVDETMIKTCHRCRGMLQQQ